MGRKVLYFSVFRPINRRGQPPWTANLIFLLPFLAISGTRPSGASNLPTAVFQLPTGLPSRPPAITLYAVVQLTPPSTVIALTGTWTVRVSTFSARLLFGQLLAARAEAAVG